MRSQCLNGTWLYRVGKGKETAREVPFSTLAVGHSECRRRFDLEHAGDGVLLKFDGITYAAKVILNGKTIGEMLPYCEYTFDVTDTVKEKNNELLVELEDIAPVFGPSEGWENFGGIIRDVNLFYVKKAYIRDVFFYTKLKNGYCDAEYTVELCADRPVNGEFRVTLFHADKTVDFYTVAVGAEKQTRTVSNIRLWSPADPALYTLQAELIVDGEAVDRYECHVGFREFVCERHRFLLNGEPIFLRGVCKHEMVGDSGHVVTEEQMETDMRMIKETGCNFVRLVHYPHNKKILEIADRLGLMVSEEPGLWWSNTGDPDISAGSLEVLKRTILRDRNHAAIMFWLSFNECKFTEQFLVDSAKVCRKYDPTRLVSGANCMSDEDTLKYYNICGFDFYTMHPYAPSFDRSRTSAKILYDKPLLFTEWGGYFVYDNHKLLIDFINGMKKLYRANSDEGALAGAIFWCWAEVNDFNRGRPACEDGVLKEGLVDKYRNKTTTYHTFCEAWADESSDVKPESLYDYRALDRFCKNALVCRDENNYPEFFRFAQEKIPPTRVNLRWRKKITVGPALQKEEIKGISCHPYVLTDGACFAFEGSQTGNVVTLLGAVSALGGYPLSGAYGDEAAKVTVCYETGETDVFTLKNGVDFTTVYTTLSSSRIDPQAENATRFAEFSYDRNFENYLINRLDLDLGGKKTVKRVQIESLGKGYDLLIYGVYI